MSILPLLLSLASLAATPATKPAGVPANQPVCELYAIGHFGNWYEVAGQRELRRILAEAKAWGYTRYGDWFDTLDCVDPFTGDRQYSLGNALWDRKKANFLAAQSLGLELDLVIAPNHVYRDQLRPEWLATRGPRIQGQLICPHRPGAREAILENQRQLLADLAAAGVRLKSITLAPYDYGGCACEQCRPWILTFAELSCAIHRLARQYHPGVELHFIGWWWTAEEHRQFATWMDAHAPGAAASISLHMPYGVTRVPDVPLPRGCRRFAFVHIGYADEAQPRDVYGMTGPVVAARRLEASARELQAQGVTGVVAYSEGLCDDVNKALLAGLFTGRYRSADELLQAYAKRYFHANEPQAAEWAAWLAAWGRPYARDATAAGRAMESLSGDAQDWRRRQWALKCELFTASQAIGTATDWSRDRLAQAERFWAACETLQREVYGLGPQRHIFAPAFMYLPWCKSWFEHQRRSATQPAAEPREIGPEQ